jgi:hypothetical protein
MAKEQALPRACTIAWRAGEPFTSRCPGVRSTQLGFVRLHLTCLWVIQEAGWSSSEERTVLKTHPCLSLITRQTLIRQDK